MRRNHPLSERSSAERARLSEGGSEVPVVLSLSAPARWRALRNQENFQFQKERCQPERHRLIKLCPDSSLVIKTNPSCEVSISRTPETAVSGFVLVLLVRRGESWDL